MATIFKEQSVIQRPRFWTRQFAPVATSAQNKFDVIFGVILPTLCFMADPIVFQGGFGGQAELQNYQLVAYVISAVEMGLFLTWRTFGKRLAEFSPVFAGAFFAGALFSTAIGVAILPLSLVGLMLAIGILGFTPFVTAFVYLRTGIRALRVPRLDSRVGMNCAAVVLGATLSLALPYLASVEYDKVVAASVQTLISGSPEQADAAAIRLQRLHFVPLKYQREISWAYAKESNPAKKNTLQRTFKNITGEDLEQTHNRWND